VIESKKEIIAVFAQKIENKLNHLWQSDEHNEPVAKNPSLKGVF